MSLEYRMHTKEDLPEMARLWSEHTGWGEFNWDASGRSLLRSPYGESFVSLAIDKDTGEIAGQFVFIPSRVVVDCREIAALRPFAPIMSKRYRGSLENPFTHPVMGMYQCAVKALRKQGFQLLYSLPDPRWRRVFAVVPWLQVGSFPLYSLPLPLEAPLELGTEFSASPLDEFTEELDRLWRTASRQHPCVVRRDAPVLRWKKGDDDHVLGIRRRGELVGTVMSVQKGDRQWLISDVLAADSEASLRATLAAAGNLAHTMSQQPDLPKPIIKVAVLTTPFMERQVRALGFRRDDYDFLLVIHVLDRSLPKDIVDPSRWYVGASD